MRTRGEYGTVVSARDLSIEYRSIDAKSRHVAVRGVSFDLLQGEVLGVIGLSGSGKSTLAMTIAGVAGSGSASEGIPRICGGELSVFDTGMRGIGHRAKDRLTLKVGYLAQDGAQSLSSRLTVAENVAEPIYLRDRRFSTRDAADAVATLIDAVHLPLSIMTRQPFELSSGQRQRVALARALILEPQLLVADEPIRGVDITVRHDVLDVIPELQEDRGFSAIVVSSELEVVTQVAPRIAVLHDGVIVGIGSLAELTAMPEHPYLKALARAVAMQDLRQPIGSEERANPPAERRGSP